MHCFTCLRADVIVPGDGPQKHLQASQNQSSKLVRSDRHGEVSIFPWELLLHESGHRHGSKGEPAVHNEAAAKFPRRQRKYLPTIAEDETVQKVKSLFKEVDRYELSTVIDRSLHDIRETLMKTPEWHLMSSSHRV